MSSIPCLHEVASFTLDGPSVTCVAASPGGGFLSSQFDYDTFTGCTRVWNCVGEVVATLDNRVCACIAVGSSGKVVAGYADGLIKVWRDSTHVFTRHHGRAVSVVAVSPLDGIVVSGGHSGKIKLWDGSTGVWLNTLEGHIGMVRAVCVLENGDMLSGSYDKTVRVWERGYWTCTAIYDCPGEVLAVKVMPLGGFAVCGGTGREGFVSARRGGAQRWRADTRSWIQRLEAVNDMLVACARDKCMVMTDDGAVLTAWMAHGAKPVALCGGKVAVVEDNKCRVFRVVRPSRLGAIVLLIAAWEAHGGVPPPVTEDSTTPASAVGRTLSLRRLCRPRGESKVGRATEVVEPFGQAVVAFL